MWKPIFFKDFKKFKNHLLIQTSKKVEKKTFNKFWVLVFDRKKRIKLKVRLHLWLKSIYFNYLIPLI